MPEERRPSGIRAYPSTNSGKRSEAPRGDWEIVLSGDLSDDHSELAGKLLEVPRRSKGTLFIDSSGGSVFSGLAMTVLGIGLFEKVLTERRLFNK